MNKVLLQLIGWMFISIIYVCPVKAEPLVASFSGFQLSIGEAPNWNNPDFSADNDKAFFAHIDNLTIDGVFWLRWQLDISQGFLPERDMVLRARTLASYQIFWDDKLIGANGVVASDKTDEIPGDIETEFLLPNHWITKGKHITSLKLSSHYRQRGDPLVSWININEFTSNQRYFSYGSLVPTLLVSISLMIAIYFMTLFLSERSNKSYLIFCLLCIDLFIFGLALQWPHMVGYSYDWYVVNNQVAFITGAIFPAILPLFFLFKYRISHLWPVILLMPVSALILVNIELGSTIYWGLGIALSAIIVAYVVKKNNGRYWWELLGLIICFAGIVHSNTHLEDFFYFFPFLVLFILLSNAIEARQQRLASFRFKLKSSQLEAQLLRKNIQPHFILNSLASLVEWVETEPDKSVEFIAALADEFRLFAEVSGQESVTLNKEIELCRQHLAIMTFRLQRDFVIDCQQVDEHDVIPPGVIHTLIENAFSHNDYGQQDIQFLLVVNTQQEQQQLIFSAPIVANEKSKFAHLGTGTGMNFIEAQMTQKYGQKWSISQQKQQNCWQTVLTYPKEER